MKFSVIAALTLALGIGTLGCSEESTPNTGTNPKGGSTNHLTGPAPKVAACDDPNEPFPACYDYTGPDWTEENARTSCNGTLSTTAGCTSSGRGGRCTYAAGDPIEYVAHCYKSTSECRAACEAIEGEFKEN